MFRLLRPDADQVWHDPEVCQRFSRYYGIMNDERIARYLVAKKVPAENLTLDDSDEKHPLEKLWGQHDALAPRFRSLLNKIDDGEEDYHSLDTPEYSFLDLKTAILQRILENCELCERRCHKNRYQEQGHCRLGSDPVISSAHLHFGEESPLVPSGTIFFESCVFNCVFCQNSDISQEWDRKDGKTLSGEVMTPERMARLARHLAREGARNINYVTPTANASAILDSLKFQTTNVTQLWNSNMYSTERVWRLVLDVMDFHLPDFKYWDYDFAKRMSGVRHYRKTITRNIKLAHEVGSGEIIIRHLVMPGRVEADTIPILEWVAKDVPRVLVNIMGQYRPAYKVQHDSQFRDFRQRPSKKEMERAFRKADELEILWRPVS
ncbi:MAG: radical SAM protein [Candidatus Hodarchaeales archaeon]|jgi:putative pyruvate formate lyase activating enzyme